MRGEGLPWRMMEALKNGAADASLLVAMDFDGTLASLAPHPEKAAMPVEIHRLLKHLSRKRSVRVVIASGRSLRNIKSKVGLRGLYYIGNHGLEIQGPGGMWLHPAGRGVSDMMRKLAKRLPSALTDFPGVWLENKIFTLCLHFRSAPAGIEPRSLRKLLDRFIQPYRDRLRIAPGKKVWEIRPRLRWNKGKALRKILERMKGKWIVLFVGDDATDEEGFRSLGPRAMTVRVGHSKKSRARFRLRNQKQVSALLRFLCRSRP